MANLLAHYASDSEEETSPAINAAPDVDIHELQSTAGLEPGAKEMSYNVPYNAMTLQGPSNPFKDNQVGNHMKHWTGTYEATTIDESLFSTQEKTFRSLKYAYDPTSLDTGNVKLVGDLQKATQFNGTTIDQAATKGKQLGVTGNQKKRKAMGDPGSDNYLGPWAGYEGENIGVAVGPTAEELKAAADAGALPLTGKKIRAALAAVGGSTPTEEEGEPKDVEFGQEKSLLHVKDDKDYHGSFMEIPKDVNVKLDGEPYTQDCKLPKKVIHTFSGHSKGVNAVRFFPKSGHLILSASMDGKIKLWDVYHSRRCIRTYIGHSKGVRDVCFNNDGTKFLSASYDKWIKLWDTETGQCLQAFSANKKVPYCIKWQPSHENIFLAGCADKRIYQFDINSGDIVQEYDQHQSAVNTITFIDDNTRFISSSDDKTLRVWDYDIPVVVKLISDPHMHAINSTALSPSKKWLACQSLDNQITIYSTSDKFKLNRNKRFAGHLTAGYACQVNFSPDNQFIMSGDSEGKLVIWDWKTGKIVKKMPVHKGVVVGCEWHPQESSKVVTCGWDGQIHLLE